MKEPTSEFGNALRKWRRANEMSGAALGARLKITAGEVSRLELGSGAAPQALLEKLTMLGFQWPVEGLATVLAAPTPVPSDQVSIPIVSPREKRGRDGFTQGELNSKPWANNDLTLGQYLNAQEAMTATVNRQKARYDVSGLQNVGAIESFFRCRDLPMCYFTYFEAASEVEIREAILAFLASLLTAWHLLPVWQRRTIKQAVEDSLRANEQWLETRDRYIDRGDARIGARLRPEIQQAYEAIEAIPDPEAAPAPFLRADVQKAAGIEMGGH